LRKARHAFTFFGATVTVWTIINGAGFPREVDVVRGDLSMPGTLDECLVGVEAVFLLCSISADPGPKWLRVKAFPGVVVNGFKRYQSVGVSSHPGNRKQRKGGF
jgi:hypothetical protein